LSHLDKPNTGRALGAPTPRFGDRLVDGPFDEYTGIVDQDVDASVPCCEGVERSRDRRFVADVHTQRGCTGRSDDNAIFE
jgi:hypothetical protein